MLSPRLVSSLAFLLLMLALVAEPSSSAASGVSAEALGLFKLVTSGEGGLDPSRTCGGLIGECIDEEEEMMMESEVSRRGLRARARYISYGALYRNRVPCTRRGYSYYNCRRSGARRANPYRRGCTYITHCARNLY